MADVQMTLTVVLSTQLSARVDAAACAVGRTRANYVRQLLEQLHPETPEKKKETK